MRVNSRVLGWIATLLLVVAPGTRAWAAPATPLFTDINANPTAHGVTEISTFGNLYTFDDAAQFNGNDVLSINQNGISGSSGITVLARVSNGENGWGGSGTPVPVGGPDIDNADPPNAVFTTIGNPSGRLENGNVIRMSAWFRSDPRNPIDLDPQVQPVLKLELWKEALSSNGDFSGPILRPNFGDRLFDQDQQQNLLAPADKAQWIDFNGDGIAGDALAPSEGRVSSITTTGWTLVESTYKVDVADFGGIGGGSFGAGDVTVIESIVASIFMGDFANTDLTGDGNGGNLLIDNMLIEVFRDQASVTPNTNPNPVPEPGSLVLVCLTMLAAGHLRRRVF